MSPVATTAPNFRERQWIAAHWWVTLLLAGTATLGWWGFVQQILLGRPFGDHPAPDWVVWLIWALAGCLFPTVLLSAHMTTEARDGHLLVTYVPFFYWRLAYGDIAECVPVNYRPLWQYGGWGIRCSPGRGWAWTVHGDRGVFLVFRNGRRLLVGSQRPEQLAAVVNARRAAWGEGRGGLSPS